MKKAFTLVEIIAVIIIIGILMGALLPHIFNAETLTKNTARHVAISHINTALIAYYSNYHKFPEWNCTSDLRKSLFKFLKTIPKDPLPNRITYWTKEWWCTSWSYAYTTLYKNGAKQGGFILIGNIEWDWWSANFVLPKNNKSFFKPWISDINKINWKNINTADDIDGIKINDLTNAYKQDRTNTKLSDSSFIDIFTCSNWVKLSSEETQAHLCNTYNNVNEWQATSEDNIIYIDSH